MARLQLRDEVCAAWSHGEIVLLDLLYDKYYGLDREASLALVDALNGLRHDNFSKSTLLTLDSLRSKGLTIVPDAASSLRKQSCIYEAREPGGLSTFDYLRDPIRAESWNLTLLLQALFILLRVDLCARRRSMRCVVQSVEQAQRAPLPGLVKCREVEARLIHQVTDAIDCACLIYPRRVSCLIRAGALALLLLKKNVSVALVVGVQKYPFYAHAWVEYCERVVGDSEEVGSRLAQLLRIESK